MPSIGFEARRPWLADHVIALQARGDAVVCGFLTDGSMAGFFTLDWQSGYLDQLCVAPSLWGRGVASALIDEAKRRSSGVIVLDVNQENERAVRFYERVGFLRGSAGINVASGLKTWRYSWRCDVSAPPEG
jgi:putative acetyltransferase